jgi:hypothetical protein
MRFAREYSVGERDELDRIDRIEGLFHTPLPALLDAMADVALPAGELHPPPAVLAAARRADRLNASTRAPSLPLRTWIRCAAGHWWLLERLLAERDPTEVAATLQPPAGARFCDWAGWVERDCPEPLRGVVLAALHVLAAHGRQAAGAALEASGLLAAVEAWLGSSAGAIGTSRATAP